MRRHTTWFLVLILLLVTSAATALAAPKWTHSVSGSGEFSLNPWSFDMKGVLGDAQSNGRGFLRLYETQSNDLLYVARVECVYVNEEDSVAVVGGPVLWQSDLLAPENDGVFWTMKDSPDGDMFRPGSTGGVIDWASFCSNAFFYPARVNSLVPIDSGDISIAPFIPGR